MAQVDILTAQPLGLQVVTTPFEGGGDSAGFTITEDALQPGPRQSYSGSGISYDEIDNGTSISNVPVAGVINSTRVWLGEEGLGEDDPVLYSITNLNASAQQLGLALISGSPAVLGLLLAGSDVINGSAGNDLIQGLGGADTIFGGAGNDWIEGDSNADPGVSGNDTLLGGAGDDIVFSGPGNDVVALGAGFDTAIGEAGDDLLNGEGGNDAIDGGEGNDTLLGWDDQDILFGSPGGDLLYGGNGDDIMMGNRGDPNDLADGVDIMLGEAGADQLHGGASDDGINGGDGNDQIDGSNGNDAIVGGPGADIMLGSHADALGIVTTGNDLFVYYGLHEGGDSIYGFDMRAGNQDIIYLVPLLDALGITGNSLAALASSGHLRVLNGPNGAAVLIDANGGGDAYSTLLVTLVGVNAAAVTDSSFLFQ